MKDSSGLMSIILDGSFLQAALASGSQPRYVAKCLGPGHDDEKRATQLTERNQCSWTSKLHGSGAEGSFSTTTGWR